MTSKEGNMETKVKISGSMLDRAKKAEEVLAREEAKGLGEFLPDDHPLKAEVERQKSMMGGDLAGLPPGHPLLRALETARRQYEAKRASEAVGDVKGSGDGVVVRKAKRLDQDAARRQARRQEDELADRRRDAVADVNRGIEAVLKASKELFEVVSQGEEALSSDPFGRAKAARLKRLLFATERGISECRIVRV